jgi:anti-anti-sigma factor
VIIAAQGPLATMTLCGELDLYDVPELDRTVARLDLGALTTLVVDFTGVSFADSSAIKWLVHLRDRAATRDCALVVVVGRDGAIDRLLTVTCMDSVMTIARDGNGLASA